MQFLFRYWMSVAVISGTISCQDETKPADSGPNSLALSHPDYFPKDVAMPADNPLTEEGVLLGRMLFYEKKLSADGTISCASCHQQEKAFSDGKVLSSGVNGILGDKNAMSLANLHWQGRFFWDGRAISLEEQAIQPIEDPREMNLPIRDAIDRLKSDPKYPELFKDAFGTNEITAQKIGKSIAQFERTLVSGNSKFDKWIQGEIELTETERIGMELFFTHPEPGIQLRGGNCGDCHLGFLTSGDKNGIAGFHNNGLETEEKLPLGLAAVTNNPSDKGKFKAPTLRNIALTAPYMHDGRFSSLEEVLDHYNEHIRASSTLDVLILEASNEFLTPGDPVRLQLSQGEKQAILAFLHTLTDEDFIKNEKFSNPFK